LRLPFRGSIPDPGVRVILVPMDARRGTLESVLGRAS